MLRRRVLTSLMLFTAVRALAAERFEVQKAFAAGHLELTFTAKEEGAAAEVSMKNVSGMPLAITVEKGRTSFEFFGNRKITLVAAEAKAVEIAPGGVKSLTFPIDQEGPGRWTSGSVTKTPAPKRQ